LKRKRQTFALGVRLAIVNLVLAGIMGVAMRWHLLWPLPGLNLRHWTHAHSHVALLGWVFMALISLVYAHWLPDGGRYIRRYRIFLWLCQLSVAGMAITFPLMGYAAASIAFSTLHMLLSLYVALMIFRHTRSMEGFDTLLLHTALWCMLISALGPLALGPLSALGYKYTVWYNAAVYFYLHFQYNGWFTLCLLAIVLRCIQVEIVPNGSGIFYLIVVGVVLSFCLSLLGFQVPVWIVWTGMAGAVVQLIGLVWLASCTYSPVRLLTKPHQWLLYVAFAALLIKCVLQLLSGVPFLTELAYNSRDVVIAYLHLVLLGFVTALLFWLLWTHGFFSHRTAGWSIGFFLLCFTATELLLLWRGLSASSAAHFSPLIHWLFLIAAAGMSAAFAWLFLLSQRSTPHRPLPIKQSLGQSIAGTASSGHKPIRTV
jgi:hypothetical protein